MNIRRLLGCGAAALLAGVCSFSTQGQVLSEGFEDITTLTGAGWVRINNSVPPGTTAWFQGNPAVFPAHAGPTNSYIGANFNNVSGLNTISNWLQTPPLTLQDTMQLKFYTQAPSGTFPDRLQVRMSLAGNSSNVGANATSVGDFTTLLLDINPTYSGNNYPEGYPFGYWQEFTITIDGVPTPTLGRLAFRYFVEDGGPPGANSNYIGIDTVTVSAATNPCQTNLPFCPPDVFPAVGDGLVNIDDLLTVINSWGQNGNPNGPRPPGDCAPGATGDCLVNIDDILAIINGWGVCPVPTGACCVQGVCSVLTVAQCSAQFGSFQGVGMPCNQVVCPIPPPNDLCGNAAVASNGANNWNNTNANFDGPAIPGACFPNGGGGRGDVWFTYTATCTGNVTFDTAGTAAPFTDTVLQVFDGATCNPVGTMLSCNDDIDFGANNLLSRVTIAMAQNQVVRVRCMANSASAPSNGGAAVLNIVCAVFNNDFCGDASSLSVPGTVSASIQGATLETEPNCLPGGAGQGRGRWYRVVGNGNTLTASTCTSPQEFTWDGRLAVYCGLNCPDLTCVVGSQSFDCGPSGVTQTGLQERVTWCSKNGQDYWILVSGDTVPLPPEGNYTLVVSNGAACANAVACGLAPQNNNCANAIVINNGTTSFSTVYATTDGTNNVGLPSGVTCSDSGGTQTVSDIWYSYTATCNGLLTINTCSNLGGNSNYDSDLVLYPGNAVCPPPANSVVACNDDDLGHPCGSAPPWSSTLTTQVTSGSTYILRVGGWANATDVGTGVINITCQVAVCGNGILEAGEQCDDGNAVPGDGCTNCQIDPNCAPACTLTEPEACGANDNGGCNSTPEAFTTVSNGTVVCALSWADNNLRDTDWYHVTVGDSGRVEVHLQSTGNLSHVFLVGSGACPNPVLPGTADSELQACAVAVASGLTPGSTATIIVLPGTTDFGIFNGFPCSSNQGYKMRVFTP